MKTVFWKTKNNFAAKSLIDQQTKQLLLCEKKYNIKKQQQEFQANISKYPFLQSDDNKQSNFEQLKKQIRFLEDSQVVSMKYKVQTEPDLQSQYYQFKSTGKEFYPQKKVAQVERFKIYLRKKGKSKRLSLLLDAKSKNPPPLIENTCLESLKIRDMNQFPSTEIKPKKKQTPFIVKKFYRPMTSSHKSLQELIPSNQLRGRRLHTSSTTRKNKENVLICCY